MSRSVTQLNHIILSLLCLSKFKPQQQSSQFRKSLQRALSSNIWSLSVECRAFTMYMTALKHLSIAADVAGMQWCFRCRGYSLGHLWTLPCQKCKHSLTLVSPSVTRRYFVKITKASIMISSPSGSPTILFFWCQISSQNSKGFPERGPQRRMCRENLAIFTRATLC